MAKTLQENKSGLRLDTATVDKMGHDAAEVGVGVIMVLAAMIGIWGIACLVGGIAQGGIGEMLTGYIAAVTGH